MSKGENHSMPLGYQRLLSQDLQQGLGALPLFTPNPMGDWLEDLIADEIPTALIHSSY
ncbi:hypothetical protein KBZ07_07975 [Cyanobium sp. BA20m-14]|uniref:hypothetical protein n=1 Tax=Cyanobium sp. BA20m-14 TaxID=2823703 RepID=UPI0020CCECCD|nr:hypothetical protein [Cyanobium sp. BA20m-14]MCP9913344.1 hypothetical protein [Cyanobium sp. BA20m-14]